MKRNHVVLILVVLAVFSGLLALDLANHGLAWRVFWNLTGEEAPLAQIRGMVEWAGNFTRVQPRTDPMVPIGHTTENPYGINMFLQEEVEPEKRERILQMVADAGFTWIRQQFPWEDIEIHGRGDFEDRRNDLNGDGTIDTVSAWNKYDQIVELADRYDVRLFARLDNPPAWSRSNLDAGDFAPPDDVQDFVNYATAIAERYRGRIQYYQVWNEPNIYPEWGNQDVSPEDYTDLLCRTYAALKAVDPDNVVISGALASTISLTGRDLSDTIFLQRMYDVGAADCFDILAVQGYGFNSGPTDRRMRPTTINFAHNLYLRDLMVANGDEATPIWITEAAWNPQPRDPSVVTSLYGNYGIVTEEQAARYMPLAYQRAQEEWPWVGAIFYWFFKRPADYEINQSWYYFRMVEPDFTPLPIYDSMKAYITTQEPVLYPGVYQAEHWAVSVPDAAQLVERPGAEEDVAVLTTEATFTTYGTAVWLRWRGGGEVLEVERDGENTLAGGHCTHELAVDEWHLTVLCSSLTPQQHTFHIVPVAEDDPLYLDSITVLDRTYANLYPLLAGVVIGVGMLMWVVFQALRERNRK
ncbi:MAG: cellulase family glycosylhydrolase [Anaerolineae bacterium]|nr:cellulase family glycosylhydrolase [Anaerolineae bacterium]